MTKQYGEFQCPHCDQVFFEKKKLDGHIGGAHKRNTTKDGIPRCKFCKKPLKRGFNWAEWAVKQRNLICTPCKNAQNRKSYMNRKKRILDNKRKGYPQLKERLKNAKKRIQ